MPLGRPRALRPGDLIGVAAPAGTVDRERLSAGVAELERLGFRVRVSPGISDREFFAAGTASRRARELTALFTDAEVKGIVCARGGAGALGVLPLLDPERLRAHPKVFVGCSDITFLHLLLGRLGQVSVHGPMVAGDLADGSYDRASLAHVLRGEGPPYESGGEDLMPLRPGRGVGELRGGCLAIVASAAGTPWALEPSAEGTVLFLEDVHERPYRIDRMLRQLRLSGAFEGLRGIVFGDMRGCAAKQDEGYALEAVILEALDGIEVPIALGLSSGHTANPAISLPLGVRASLECDAEQARFEVLEPAVE